ncbi:MAG: BBP7 family outer membrane beta-barrel protein [Planctomycetaceae bacterium]
MSASFQNRFGTLAVAMFLVTGWLGSVARSDDGAMMGTQSGGQWLWSGDEPGSDDAPFIAIRVNALFLNRQSPPSNIVLSETATGRTLLNTSDNDPSWAGGVEVNFVTFFTATTSFEFDWFTVEDWFDKQNISMNPTVVDQVPFPVTGAAISVSSRLRNMEFNLREEVYNGVTFLAGFRYVEFNDTQRVNFQSAPFGVSELFINETTNRLYGFQIGTQLDIWKTECWELLAWGKVGVYGNAADNNSGVLSTIPADNVNIRDNQGKTAFVGDLAVRGTRRFGEHAAVFLGYRLMYLDGIALAANQYQGTLNFFNTGIPSIQMGSSMLFQGIEAGLSFSF